MSTIVTDKVNELVFLRHKLKFIQAINNETLIISGETKESSHKQMDKLLIPHEYLDTVEVWDLSNTRVLELSNTIEHKKYELKLYLNTVPTIDIDDMIRNLASEIAILQNKLSFIKAVKNGKLEIRNKDFGPVYKQMDELTIPYKYYAALKFSDLTENSITNLSVQIATNKAKIDILI